MERTVQRFFERKKYEMTKQGIRVGYIILTGSGFTMSFISQIILEIFNNVSSDSLEYAMDSSRIVSKGLVLAGISAV